MDRFGTELEIKTVRFQERIIEGYAAMFGNEDRVGDVIDASAFTKTLTEKPPAAVGVFIGHNSLALPVGIPLEIRPDARGLWTKTLIKPGPVGDDLLHTAEFLQQNGQKLGMSIGYRARDRRPERKAGGGYFNRLMDIDLREYSFASSMVTVNPDATVTGVKAQEEKAVPYHIRKSGDEWCVYDKDGENRGCSATEAMAKKHMAALYAHEGGKTLDDADEETKAAIGSFEWTRQHVAAALREKHQTGCYIVEIFPQRVVYRTYSGDDLEQLYQASYSVAGDSVTVGEAAPVDVQYVPMSGSKAIEEAAIVLTKDQIDALPDSAFLHIQSGGQLDAEGKTVPRALRHFPVRVDGRPDAALLTKAIADISAARLDDLDVDVTRSRARRMLEATIGYKALPIDEPEWQRGAAVQLCAVADRLYELAERIAVEQKARRTLGQEVSGQGFAPDVRMQVKAAVGDLDDIVKHAEEAEQGRETIALLDRYERELDLIAV